MKLSLCDSAQQTDCISSIKPTIRTRGQTEGCRVIVLKKQMRQKEKLFSFSIRSVKSSYHLLVVIYPLPKVCKEQTFHGRLPCFKLTTAGFVRRQQLILVGQHCSISFCFVRHLTYLWKSSNIPGGRLPQFKMKNEMYLFIYCLGCSNNKNNRWIIFLKCLQLGTSTLPKEREGEEVVTNKNRCSEGPHPELQFQSPVKVPSWRKANWLMVKPILSKQLK